MVKVQEWFDREYPKRERESISIINANSKNLEGSLILEVEDFPNLKELDCSNNRLVEVKFVTGFITSKTRSAKKQKLEWKLKKLVLSNNDCEQNLSSLIELTELKELFLANNKFFGSLESLKNMTKLKELDISDTDIREGLEYLPIGCEKIYCSLGTKGDAKVKEIAKTLEEYRKYGKIYKNDCSIDVKKIKVELLCQAAENNDVEKFKKILEWNRGIINANSKDIHGNTPLHYAASKGNIEVVEMILQKGVKVDADGNYGFTPLHVAVGQGHWDIVFKLLGAGADPNAKSEEKSTPLHFAAERNDLKLLKLLKERGGNIDAKNVYDWSVLHSAASGMVKERGSWEVIRWLLSEGVNPEPMTTAGIGIREVLIEIGYSCVEEYDRLVREYARQYPVQQLSSFQKKI